MANTFRSPNGLAFAASVALALAAWAAPEAGASDVARLYGWLGAGMAGLVGVTLGIKALQQSVARPSPWPGVIGRIVWALRPRGWMIAWAVIIAGVSIWGTPHVVYQYPPRTPMGSCDYVGIEGVQRIPHSGIGCPWFVWR